MKFVLALCLLGLAFGQLEESFDCNTLQIETDLDTPITGKMTAQLEQNMSYYV